jgi:magnesium transporter
MTTQRISSEKVVWTNIVDPTLHDVAALRRHYPNIHPLNLEDVTSHIERPKVDFQDDYTFVVVQFPKWDPKTRLTRGSEIDFVIGRGYLITVHDGVLSPLLTTFQRASSDEEERQKLLGTTASHAFYLLIDRLVDYIFPILHKVENNIRSIEERIFDNVREEILIRDISLVRRDVYALRRIIRQQIPILEQIERRRQNTTSDEEMEEYFGDLIDHIQKARDMIDEDAEVITSLSDTADTLLTHRLNGVIRLLTVISVVFFPLTLLTGIWGMNVDLPFQSRQDAFLLIALLMAAIVTTMIFYFRRRNWL